MSESKKLHASLARRGDMNVADLRANAKKLYDLAGQLQSLADNAEQEKVASLRIDGITKLSRGLELVRDFTANATQSLFKASVIKSRHIHSFSAATLPQRTPLSASSSMDG